MPELNKRPSTRKTTDLPSVTVVIPSHNGLSLLKQSIPSQIATNFPSGKLRFLVLDNGSTDGTVKWLSSAFPTVKAIQLERNTGFAIACNRGAREAETPYVAFLNNDMKVDQDWLMPLVEALQEGSNTIAAGSKVLSWDGKKVDFGGADLNFEARAFQRDFQHSHNPALYKSEDAIFLNGGAMVVKREEFLKVGAFDEGFFAYYEDVDFGWRAWILGYTLKWVPESVTFHFHGATSARLSKAQKRFLLERNALLSMFKNYDADNLARALSSSLLLSAARTLSGSDIRRRDFFLWPPAPQQDTVSLQPESAAHVAAVSHAIKLLPSMAPKREQIQEKRRRSDREVFKRFGKPMEPIHPGREYARIQQNLLTGTGLRKVFDREKKHVLLISPDILPLAGLPTTGAGLRAWGLGQGLLAHGLSVTYSIPKAALAAYPNIDKEFKEFAWDESNLSALVHKSGASVVVACGWPLLEQLAECPRPIVLDFHGPHLLERTIQKHLDPETNIRTKLCCLARADFFTCAGDRQRSYFLPWLLMSGIPYSEDMIHQVPVCLSPSMPERKRGGNSNEPVFVYGGVFLPWQDPSLGLTVLVEELEKAGRGKLELYGGRHPFIPLDTKKFEELVKKLESSSHVVSFGMVTHDRLLEAYSRATAAIDVMVKNPERELAFTTRTVEYLWCGLPVIYNNYADLAHLIRDYRAGWVVDPEDAESIRSAVKSVLNHPDEVVSRSRNATKLIQERLTWDKAVKPLVEFCVSPSFRTHTTPTVNSSAAAELAATRRAVYDKDVHIRNLEAMLARRSTFFLAKHYLGRASHYHRHGGTRSVAMKVMETIRRRTGRGLKG